MKELTQFESTTPIYLNKEIETTISTFHIYCYSIIFTIIFIVIHRVIFL